MNPLSVPPLIMAGITSYVGAFHLFLFFRRIRQRENLTFAYLCLSVVVYDFFSSALYNASSVTEGAVWQRLQVITLAFVCIGLLWFFADFTSLENRKGIILFTVYFVLSAILGIVDKSGLVWHTDQPSIKQVHLPFGHQITYFEVTPGPATNLQSILGLAVFVYIGWIGLRLYQKGERKRSIPLLLSLGLSFLGAINDTAVSSGLYDFVYIIEYVYLAIVLLMTYALADTVVETAIVREALKESEEKYRTLFESAPESITLIGLDGRIMDCNDATADLAKTNRRKLIGKSFTELVVLDGHDISGYLEVFAQISKGEKLAPLEIQISRNDKETRWLEVFTSPLKTEEQVYAIQVIALDITERKQAEEAQRFTNALLLTQQQVSPDGILVVDENGKILSFNQRFVDMWKMHSDVMASESDPHIMQSMVAQVVGPDQFQTRVQELYQNREERSFDQVALVDGRTFERYSTPMLGPDRYYGRVWYFRDITERIVAATALQESEERYKQLVKYAPSGIFEIDLVNWRLLSVNDIMCEYSGYSREEFLSLNPLDLLAEDREKRFLETFAETQTGERVPEALELPVRGKNGREFWVILNSRLVYQDGMPVRATVILHDITRRKREEQLLQSLNRAALSAQTFVGPDEIFANAAQELKQLGYSCTIFLMDKSRNQLRPVLHSYQAQSVQTAEKLLGHRADNLTIPIQGIEVFEKVIWQRETVFIENAQEAAVQLFPRLAKGLIKQIMRILQIPKSINAPLIADDQVIGVFTVQSDSLIEEDIPTITAFAHLIASAWHKAQLFEQAQQEIAERKRAEELFKSAQWEKELILDSQMEHVIYQDLDHRILWPNRAACESVKASREALIGRFCYEVWPHSDKPCDDCPVKKAMELGQQYDIEKSTPDGRSWFIRGYPVWDSGGRIVGGIEVTRDITEQTQAKAERERLLAQIQEQAQQVEQIVNTVPEGVLLTDAESRILLVNPAAQRYLDQLTPARPGDLLTHLGGRPIDELLTSPPQGLWHQVMVENQHFEVIARPLEAGPQPEGWVLVIRDITQEREILQRSQQEERLMAVGQLAAGIAHDFNNIIAVIVLYAQIMLRSADLSDGSKERLVTIIEQAKRATNLIQQILDFSRRALIERQPLDLIPFLKEQIKLLNRTLPESIKLELNHGADEYIVNADPTRIQQAIMNLAVNARDAMPQGGKLRIDLDRIRVSGRREAPLPEMEAGDWIRMIVADSGGGIDPDKLPHIFEPFFTTKSPGQGTGLGLAQVYGIVKQHEGHIEVSSEAGQGATFILYLPAQPISRARVSLEDINALTKGLGEVILVVEDNRHTRQALVSSLEMLNYRVLQAGDGEEALALIQENQDEVTLVLSDVVMPKMGGIALLHALRQRGLDVPVILLTGHAFDRELESLRIQNPSGWVWIPKPPSLEQLAQTIASAMKQPRGSSRPFPVTGSNPP